MPQCYVKEGLLKDLYPKIIFKSVTKGYTTLLRGIKQNQLLHVSYDQLVDIPLDKVWWLFYSDLC